MTAQLHLLLLLLLIIIIIILILILIILTTTTTNYDYYYYYYYSTSKPERRHRQTMAGKRARGYGRAFDSDIKVTTRNHTSSLYTKIIQTKICWLKTSGKAPMDMRSSPLEINSTLATMFSSEMLFTLMSVVLFLFVL